MMLAMGTQVRAGQTPTSLFEDPAYLTAQFGDNQKAVAQAEVFIQASRQAEATATATATATAGAYVITTILIAIALFFAGSLRPSGTPRQGVPADPRARHSCGGRGTAGRRRCLRSELLGGGVRPLRAVPDYFAIPMIPAPRRVDVSRSPDLEDAPGLQSTVGLVGITRTGDL